MVGYHPILKKLVEIGNSGVFRPEMMIPLGFDADIRVIAWGLSLERPTMIQYDVKDIRTMIGHEVKIDTVRQNPFCLFG
jgi:phenylalanyl-tRNA synthetase alpha chain